MKYTTEQAIKNLKEVDKKLKNFQYSYENTIYTGSVNQIIVNCSIHGDFKIQYNNKLQGQGCKLCSRIRSKEEIESRFDKFKKKVQILYPNLLFDKFIYKDYQKRSIVTCKLHGDFLIAPKHLLDKSNCPKCTKEKRKKILKKNILFENKIKEKFKDSYQYENIPFVTTEKFKLNCKKHGIFEKTVETLLNSAGCPKCSYENRNQIKPFSEFIEKANKIHNNKYSYKQETYQGTKSKIEIICPIHGNFFQNCGDHLAGKGCKSCGREYSNYSKSHWIRRAKNKKGIFYILKCVEEDKTEFYKIGITFNSIKQRYSKGAIPYNYEIIKEIKSFDLGYIWDLEKETIKSLQKYKYKPLLSFKGDKNECFSQI